MIEVPVYNQSGQKVDSLQVDEQKLGGTVRRNLLKQALVMYHANQRQGSAQTLARGEVEGSTKKIFRQKGTGNARMGAIRQPVRRGGGHAKQKRPKDWRQELPKTARKLARNSAILSKIESSDIRVLDAISFQEPKTKLVVQMLKALGVDRTYCLALSKDDPMIVRAARNIQRSKLTTVAQLNAWDIMQKRTLLLTRDGLEQILA